MTKTRATLERLVEAERQEQPPPDIARLGWDRLSRALQGAAVPLDVAMDPLKVPSNAFAAKALAAKGFAAKVFATKGLLTMAVLGATTAGVGYGTWVVGEQAPGSSRSNAALYVRAPSRAKPTTVAVPAKPVSRVEASDERASDLVPGSDTKREPSATQVPAKGQRGAPSPSAADAPNDSTFDAELDLLKRAKAEFDQGRPHLAAVWLDEHAERFPSGVFAAERDALRVLLGCLQRPGGNAALAGQEFLQAHPESPVADRIRRACHTPNDFAK